jgi:hypothetical protein
VRTEIGREKLALLKLERGAKESELLPKDDVRSMNVTIMHTVKARLLAVPRAIAPRLLHISRAAEAEEVANSAITGALEELSRLGDVSAKPT